MADLGGCVRALWPFFLLLWGPGSLIGDAANLGGFRTKGALGRLVWSWAISFSVAPILFVAAAWLTGLRGAIILAYVLTGCAVLQQYRRKPRNEFSSHERNRLLLLGSAWVAVVLVSLVDFGHGSGLWMSVTAYDHSVRVAFVDSVMRTGVPPANPLYWPGHDAPMRYYYFWYVLCGIAAQMAHVSARQAFVASCVWPFFGVLATVALFLREHLGLRGPQLRRTWWLAVAFLSITGFDLCMTALGYLGGGSPPGDLEWWSVAQVTSWFDTFLWTPHHAAALVSSLMCLLLLCVVGPEAKSRRDQLCCSVLAGLSFASTFGLSSYLAIATAILLAAWFARSLFSDGRTQAVVSSVIAAVFGIGTLTPYLLQVLKPDGQGSANHRVLGFAIREMLPPKMLLGIPALHSLAQSHPWRASQISAVLLLLPGYFFELGFFAILLLVALRPGVLRSAAEKSIRAATLVTLLVATVLRSTVIATNDFSVRASLLPQFGLLLLAAVLWDRLTQSQRRLLYFAAAVGIAGTTYQAVMLRSYLPYHQLHGDRLEADLAQRNLVYREAFAAMEARTPPTARVQYAQDSGYFMDAEALNATRQVVNAERGCNSSFGGNPAACPAIQQVVDQLFLPGASPAEQLCRQIGVDYLLTTRWDAIWQARDSWVWRLPVVASTDDFRVLACGANQR